MGLLPLVDEFLFNASNEFYGYIEYLTSDQDYEIIEVSAAIDSTGAGTGTFSVFIGVVNGGTTTTASKGRVTFPAAIPTPGAIGSLREGLLFNPNDPTAKGLYTVPLLAAAGLNVTWYAPGDRPILRRSEILVVVVVNTTNTNFGVVSVLVNGKAVSPSTVPTSGVPDRTAR